MFVRDEPINRRIASEFSLECTYYGSAMVGRLGKLSEMFLNDISCLSPMVRFNPDVIVGDALLGHIAKLLRIPSIAVVDGDPPGLWWLIYNTIYLSDVFVTPAWNLIGLRKRTIRYYGFVELAYLGPKYFSADESIFDELKVGKGEPYALLRLSALQRSHDYGLMGLTEESVLDLVHSIESHARVLISSERKLTPLLAHHAVQVKPSRMHQVMRHASLIVAETAMAVEGGILGSPSIQVSPVDGFGRPFFYRISNFRFCAKEGLIQIFGSRSLDLIKAASLKVLSNPRASKEAQEKVASAFASRFVDPVPLLADVIESASHGQVPCVTAH